jgi:AraC-like DNA-binding protein
MDRRPPPLLVLHRNGALRARLREMGERYVAVEGWDELRAAVSVAPPSALVVVDPCSGDGPRPRLSGDLRTLLWEFPSATVLAATDVACGSSRELRALGEWGVSDVIALPTGIEDGLLESRLVEARARSLDRILARAGPPCRGARRGGLLRHAAEAVAGGAGASDLARTMRRSERTVLRMAARDGLPPPRRLMAWMRILFASRLLDDPGRTVSAVARACGYASDSGLRRAMRLLVARPPAALRRDGAFTTVATAFHEELDRYHPTASDHT